MDSLVVCRKIRLFGLDVSGEWLYLLLINLFFRKFKSDAVKLGELYLVPSSSNFRTENNQRDQHPLHFSKEETKAQRGNVTYLKTHCY